MNLLLVAGQLWRQIPSTGGWYTVEECGPTLYRYVYSDDPTRDVLAPAHPGAGGLVAASHSPPGRARGVGERPGASRSHG